MNKGDNMLKKPNFDPTRIRKCELVSIDNQQMIQFIATGDRHKLIKMDDGSLEVIKLTEQGKEYRYGDPYAVADALSILLESTLTGHKTMAQQIQYHLSQSA